MKNGSNVIITV